MTEGTKGPASRETPGYHTEAVGGMRHLAAWSQSLSQILTGYRGETVTGLTPTASVMGHVDTACHLDKTHREEHHLCDAGPGPTGRHGRAGAAAELALRRQGNGNHGDMGRGVPSEEGGGAGTTLHRVCCTKILSFTGSATPERGLW